MSRNNGILLLSCPDQQGLVARITQFIYENKGNIVSLNEHVDIESRIFFLRVEWNMEGFRFSHTEVREEIKTLARELNAYYQIHFDIEKPAYAIFVSKYDHCLRDLLWRNSMQDFDINFTMIISNHSNLENIAQRYQIPFYVFPVNKDNKADMEKKELELLLENKIDTIVLARYMQILSPEFVKKYPNKIINIHHSFLPAFVGGNPYRQAYERGVKIIGATSHYVTEDLDQGPIIEQDISRISHKDAPSDLKRKGRDLERLVLAKAVKYHSEHRILVHGRKTIVFE